MYGVRYIRIRYSQILLYLGIFPSDGAAATWKQCRRVLPKCRPGCLLVVVVIEPLLLERNSDS
jgi:hypothetical protein